MRKLFLSVIVFLLTTSFCFAAGPFICTATCPRVEYFEVMLNDTLPVKRFDPQADDSLVVDVINDLNIKSQSTKVKITITAVNSDGYSEDTFFYLQVYKTINSTVYKIIPIEEPGNALYMTKYDQDHLEAAVIKETGGGKKGHGGGGGFFHFF